MNRKNMKSGKARALAASAGLALCAAMAMAGDADPAFASWLGREITIDPATTSDQIPAGGKMTLVHDANDDVVRVCTRTAEGQTQPWSRDLASNCGVTLKFTKGERYCTVEDVKAGDGEVLSSCHRLRSTDVAMSAAGAKDGVEHGDLIVFLLSPERTANAVAILVDSPSRVTNDVIVIGKF